MKGLEVGDTVLILYGRKVLSAIFIDTGDEQSKLCVVDINGKVESVERDHVFSDDNEGRSDAMDALEAVIHSLISEKKRLLGELGK